ncbi:glycosyltransferase family 2 protein [Ruminococcaceae bacterium OttesenSCG-928-O06]|nr:glycosyltransferase family 2 protein [Ruminococcaceae bacterium OttesenSCG-928-O06]
MPRISASVVMYGGAEEAKDCLDSLAQHTKGGLALYLVDNASPGDALNTLLEQGVPKGTAVFARKKNRGYGAGHNTVLPFLQSEYHAVVNPDILLQNDALGAMAAWMDEHPDVVMCCPRLLFPTGEEQHIAKRRPALLPLLSRQLGLGVLKPYEEHYLMLDEDLSGPVDVEFCSGSFFLIRTEVLRAIGGFDEGYFMYVEDADITQKALRCGRAVYLPDVSVIHAWHRAAHRDPRQFLRQCRSMARYFAKWGFKLK